MGPFDDGSCRYVEDLVRTAARSMAEGDQMHFLAWRKAELFFLRPAGLSISGERGCS